MEEEKWNDVIKPQRNWLDWRLGDLWRARDLIILFVWRDFVSVYKQTILGPLWYLIQPLLTTLTFTVIFGQLVDRGDTRSVHPYPHQHRPAREHRDRLQYFGMFHRISSRSVIKALPPKQCLTNAPSRCRVWRRNARRPWSTTSSAATRP